MPGRVLTLLATGWRRSGLGDALTHLLARAPYRVQRWVRRRKLALRIRAGEALVPERELEEVYKRALRRLSAGGDPDGVGDYLEFGVYIGTSLACMYRATEDLGLDHVRLIGFDSFEGLPAAAADDDGATWSPGDFAADEDITRANLTRQGVDWSRVELVPGWFDETLNPGTADRLNLRRVGVVMIDCDIYTSAKEALAFCEPLIDGEAIFVFDDWHSAGLAERGLGERRAFDEFLAGNPDLSAQQFDSYGENGVVFLVSRGDRRGELATRGAG